MSLPTDASSPRHAPMGFREFVAMVAALLALNALAIDIMLPALQEIGASLDVASPNDRQAVLSSYLAAFGLGQLVIGPVSDRFGRRRVLLWGLVLYLVSALICAAAPTFAALLAARVLQGLASAAPRVITISVVRDCYEGRRMASVMSLAMMVFMAVPILAPGIGQIVILFAPWQAIFAFLAVYALAMIAWTGARLPETLPPEKRRSASPREVFLTFAHVVRTRQTLGYALSGGLMFGAVFGFLNSAHQVFVDIYGLGAIFPLAFAAVALAMSMSSFLNSRLVGRLGMRRISHAAVAAFVALSALLVVLAATGLLIFPVFLALLAAAMFLLGMIFSNFNALALEPQGHAAGSASSVVGSITTVMAAVIGYGVGQAYDGTVLPLALGYFLLGAATLAVIALTERGRLFR